MAGTINAANVSIGFDASKLKIGVDATRGQMSQLRTMINNSVSDTDKYNQKLELLKLAYEKGAITAERFQAAQVALAQKMGIANQQIEEQARATQRMQTFAGMAGRGGGAGGIMSMVGMMGGPQTLGLGALAMGARAALTLSANIETAAASFEVLTGSAERANQIILDMRRLDAESPLNFSDLMQSGKTLLGFGMAADEVMPTLEALGAVSMGDANRLQSLSLAMGQVTAAGRLTGQEVLQMVNAGFNPLQIISENTGKSMQDLRKEMEEGKISVQMVKDALIAATSEGGRFAGMNEKLANTTAGAFAKLRSSFQTLGAEIGDAMAPFAQMFAWVTTAAVNTASKAANAFNNFDPFGQEEQLRRSAKIREEADKLFNPVERVKREEESKRRELEAQLEAQRKIREEAEKELETRRNITKSANQLQAEEAAGGDFEGKLKQIEDQYRRIQLGQEEFERAQFMNVMDNVAAIGSEEDKRRAKEATRQYESIKDYEKFQEKKKKDEEDSRALAQEKKKLAEEVKAVEDKFSSPRDRLREAFREVERLKKGGLSDESVRKARLEAAEKIQQERDGGIARTIAPALMAGSKEAYKFLLDRNEGQSKILDKQLIVQQEIKRNGEKQLEELKKNRPIVSIR